MGLRIATAHKRLAMTEGCDNTSSTANAVPLPLKGKARDVEGAVPNCNEKFVLYIGAVFVIIKRK